MLTLRLVLNFASMAKTVKFKTRKSWNEFGHTHFLTFSTLDRKPYFLRDDFCQLLARSITRASEKHNFAVLAYVFMPDHIHLVIYPKNEEYEMEDILKSIKLGTTKSVNRHGLAQGSIWLPGGGYDRNVFSIEERIEKIRYTHMNPVRAELVSVPAEFRWSSAAWYEGGPQGDLECHYRDECS